MKRKLGLDSYQLFSGKSSKYYAYDTFSKTCDYTKEKIQATKESSLLGSLICSALLMEFRY